MRYSTFKDPVKRGTAFDIFQWKNLIDRKHTAFFVNADYDSQQDAEVLKASLTDAIVFGRLYISNPDLAQRLINNQELNTNLAIKNLYVGGPVGYTDYPTYEQQKKQKLK